MTQPLVELVEQFCIYPRKQRGRSDGGVRTYRWILEQFLRFVRTRQGGVAHASDLTGAMIQGWMDHMAAPDLGLNTLRCRLATLSSLCTWLVKRGTSARTLSLGSIAHPASTRLPRSRGPPSWTR
jgi:site-specific recombinase XerC